MTKSKLSCWEFKQCNRGLHSSGNITGQICPAALDTSCHTINSGVNAGRICWIIAGTLCNGTVQGTFAQKRRSCIKCDFFKMVESEEGFENFNVLKPGQKYIPAD